MAVHTYYFTGTEGEESCAYYVCDTVLDRPITGLTEGSICFVRATNEIFLATNHPPVWALLSKVKPL